jgi:hypothetical protein
MRKRDDLSQTGLLVLGTLLGLGVGVCVLLWVTTPLKMYAFDTLAGSFAAVDDALGFRNPIETTAAMREAQRRGGLALAWMGGIGVLMFIGFCVGEMTRHYVLRQDKKPEDGERSQDGPVDGNA